MKTPAELWVATPRTSAGGINWDGSIVFKSESLFKCIHGKWQQQLSCCKWKYLGGLCMYLLSWTQTNRHRHTTAYPYRSFHFSGKGQLNIHELNCSLHSHLSTASRKTPPPPYTWIWHSRSGVQCKYLKSEKVCLLSNCFRVNHHIL